MLMAKAGYPPMEAVELWIRFSQAQPSSTPLSLSPYRRSSFADASARLPSCAALKYLSTHPPNADRIVRLKRWMPQAIDLYEKEKTLEAGAQAI
jgi:Zn-dependent protease with chaperone function